MDSLVTAPKSVVTMSRFDPTTGNVYILSVNGVTPLTGSFRVQGLAAGQTVTVLNENRTITASAGSFRDTFDGISRHVYAIPTTAPTVSFTGAPASAAYGSSFTVTATTNATTTATISASGACSNSGNRVTMVSGGGTCYLTASWGADGAYSAATATQSATATLATPAITWPAPAAITFGSALSSSQLDATASVPGVFAYTPAAGTVLAIGAGQTLSVTFWPNDWADYATTSASTTITVNPAPAPTTPPNLVVTNTLSRDVNRNVVVALTIANNGGSTASNVVLSAVKVGSAAGAPTPQTIGAIAAGASARATVTAPSSVGASGAASSLVTSGSYTGGSFSSSARITLP
jgi:hypothetical protein